MICDLKETYNVEGEEREQGPADEIQTGMLGKRQKSPEEEIEGANKRVKRDEPKIDAKLNDKEEEKKGEDLQPTRRSGRNIGKEANYNIDELLDAAD